ncbi:unnamed protein product [Amaranthus hypochondriacus]
MTWSSIIVKLFLSCIPKELLIGSMIIRKPSLYLVLLFHVVSSRMHGVFLLLRLLKVNFDGAFDASKDKFGLDFVVRAWNGKFVMGGSKTILVGSSAEDVEARALFWAMSCIKDRGWSNVLVGGD